MNRKRERYQRWERAKKAPKVLVTVLKTRNLQLWSLDRIAFFAGLSFALCRECPQQKDDACPQIRVTVSFPLSLSLCQKTSLTRV